MSFGTWPFGTAPFPTSGATFFSLRNASVASTASVRLLFSADLDLTSPVLDPSSYTFDGSMEARSVSLESSNTVVVSTTKQVPGQIYTVTVSTNVRGAGGEYLNDNQALFVGIAERRPTYLVSPELGLFQFTERVLAQDEVLITYASESNPTTYVEERGGFLVRKELTSHPVPTSVISFNPLGRTVAPVPAPVVFRGGRPQSSSQVSVNTAASTITFLQDSLPTPGGANSVSDALPHGAVVDPSENVYVDYYVYEAIGGENTLTVLNPPIRLATPMDEDHGTGIREGDTFFFLEGDWGADFLPNRLMRLGTDQVYYVTDVTFDGNETKVTVGQPFQDSFVNPIVYVSSGEIRLTSSGALESYFVAESAAYSAVPRGMNLVRVQGDVSSLYRQGTVIRFTDVTTDEFYLVAGAEHRSESNLTEVTLTQAAVREYQPASYSLSRSVLPVFDEATTTVRTSEAPVVSASDESVADAVTVIRQVEGQAGTALTSPEGFTIDESGKIDLALPLQISEEVFAFYTKHNFVSGSLRSSYTASIAPTASNGLLNQRLTASFSTYFPDGFFFRVETFTNFLAEVAQEYRDEAQASSPSGGPRTSNTSQPTLFEQGSESVFFAEGRLENEDIVARATLKQYNDAINYLEDLLRNMDGRVVGDHDGKFLFDGTLGVVRSSFSDAENQIDDRFKISDFPIDPTPPLFPIKFVGTFLSAYESSTESRFYPTFRNRFNYTVAGDDTSATTGTAILDFELKNLTGSNPTADRRSPRAITTRSASLGDVTVHVDDTDQVDTVPYRPAFAAGMRVVIQGSDGTFYVPQGSPLEVQSKTSTTLTFTSGLPAIVPIGATVYLADTDTAYRKSYRIGFDVTLDTDNGYLLFVRPYPPFDGSVGSVPSELEVQAPNSGELIGAGLFLTNRLTEPDRFPALDGEVLDDDGDQRLPLVNPSPSRELGSPGYLETELIYVDSAGEILTNSVVPFIGTGNINGAGTTITLVSGTFPAPVPQVGDLVRTLSGVNGESDFRRVTAVTTNSVTVDVAFTTDTSVSFLVTVAANLATGTFTTIASTTVTDLTANFVTAGVQPGHTVVITQAAHGAYLDRRQVVSVNSATELVVDSAFSSSVVPVTYRIHNPLNTYSEIDDLTTAPTDLLGILQDNADSEVTSIDGFFDAILEDRLSPATATGTASGDTLTGPGFNDVVVGDVVYVLPTSGNQGFYEVAEVTSPSTLRITTTFPVSGSTTYRVAKPFGASLESLTDLFDLRENAVAFYNSTVGWAALVAADVSVLVPPSTPDSAYFAKGYTNTDIAGREALIDARKTYLTSNIGNVEATLASSDRFYDKRFVWIDARINLETGILVQQERAVENRIRAQEETLKQLTKLLAVES